MIIDKFKYELTVITPTTGKESLLKLIDSIEKQTIADKIFHILLWDEFRSENALNPGGFNCSNRYSIVIPWGLGKNGNAPGSSLRAIGLISAFTEYVTFADDDVTWEYNHAETMLKSIENLNWTSCFRKIYSPRNNEYLGVDKFESVGDYKSRKVSYEMLDNNCMMFRRHFGVYASHLYRETTEYNDDRLMYSFLKQHAGPLGRTEQATINHTCPDRLIQFFSENCEREISYIY